MLGFLQSLLLLYSFFSLKLIGPALPQQDTTLSADKEILMVGIENMPPLAIKDDQGHWSGISVELWRQIADDLNLNYEFKEIPQDSLAARIADGSIDLALSAQTNSQDEKLVDFSHIYYATTLGVAGSSTQSLSSIVTGIFSMRFLRITLWISILLLIVGVLIWLVERKANKEHFGGDRNTVEGIGSGFWWAGVTMTTIGYGDKAPVTLLGRVLALLWMIIAMAVTASLTAAIVSVVGMGKNGNYTIPEDLREMKVGSIENTSSAAFLKQENIDFSHFESTKQGLEAIQNGDIDAFVHTTPILRYTANQNSHITTNIEETDAIPQHFAIAFQEGSPMAEELNRLILQNIKSTSWREMVNRYMPKQ